MRGCEEVNCILISGSRRCVKNLDIERLRAVKKRITKVRAFRNHVRSCVMLKWLCDVKMIMVVRAFHSYVLPVYGNILSVTPWQYPPRKKRNFCAVGHGKSVRNSLLWIVPLKFSCSCCIPGICRWFPWQFLVSLPFHQVFVTLLSFIVPWIVDLLNKVFFFAINLN